MDEMIHTRMMMMIDDTSQILIPPDGGKQRYTQRTEMPSLEHQRT
jgi:hypothetical protein